MKRLTLIFTLIYLLSNSFQTQAQTQNHHWLFAGKSKRMMKGVTHGAGFTDVIYTYEFDSTMNGDNNGTIANKQVTKTAKYIETITYTGSTVRVVREVVPVYNEVTVSNPNANVVFASAGGFRDEVAQYTSTLQPITVSPIKGTIFDSTGLYKCSHKDLKRKYYTGRQRDQPNKFAINIGGGYAPSLATRTATIGSTLTEYNTQLAQRNNSEYSTYGYLAELKLGFSIGIAHSITLSGFHMETGFKTEKDSVDFSSGMPYIANSNHKYIFGYWGFGVSYRYSGYHRYINPVVELGPYYTRLQWVDDHGNGKQSDITAQFDKNNTNRSSDVFGIKAGLGINIRPGYQWELYFVPTLYYNVTSLNHGVINTRLFNVGISTGVTYYVFWQRKH